jgi:predicted ribosomally synthesized peptide with SipW-like signal peptide
MSIAGLGLIGAGAHAIFTASTTSAQTITAGTLSMELSGPTGSTCLGTDAVGNCNNLALPAYGPTQSTFNSGPQDVVATNDGNITATNILFSLTDPSDVANAQSLAFNNEAWVCVTASNTPSLGSVVLANESLSTFETTPINVGGTELPGGIAPYTMEFFAGQANTLCGALGYGAAVDGVTSAPDTLAPVAGLDSSAMGGVIDPAFTISYTG